LRSPKFPGSLNGSPDAGHECRVHLIDETRADEQRVQSVNAFIYRLDVV
jgi:hypothetical protein